jgi:glycosyltransferase involved in cell wall biosynthesis
MRLVYVLPRYGPQVFGGAEMLAKEAIKHLIQRGHYVEVWTTCVQNLYTWANERPAGVECDGAVKVCRFPVQKRRQYHLFSEPLSLENQYRWVDSLPHSPELYTHIADNAANFDFLIFMPYIIGTTFHGAGIRPQKSIIWPCLHEELPAFLVPTRLLLASVAGLIFNTPFEQDFMVKKLRVRHPRTVVAGMGFDIPSGDANAFRQKYPNVAGQFIVYIGRLDASKNVDLLIQYFDEYQSRHDHGLNLVLLGEGPLGRQLPAGVISLGSVDEVTKRNALAAATLLCQPSLYESFSIVLMEAWSQRRPVLVHEHCAVTVGHVRQSQGGLYFASYSDFEGVVDYLVSNPGQANAMGTSGYGYVRQNYGWPPVIDRLEQAIQSWLVQTQ